MLEPSSTVREAITLSALLKLPQAMPAADKAARVDGILAELDLLGCQHTLIGDEMLNIKGISGGQRRRVSGALRCASQVDSAAPCLRRMPFNLLAYLTVSAPAPCPLSPEPCSGH